MRDKESEGYKTPSPKAGLSFDRRDFLKLIGGGIVVFFTCDPTDLFGQAPSYPTDFNAYLRIAEDGKVTVFSGKIEMGQGVITSLAQEAADELGVGLESIEMIMGDTDLCPYDNGTYGSMSTRFFGPALRAAAAEARTVLLDLAAEQLKAPPKNLSAEDGVVFVTADKRSRVTFGQLARGKKITRKLDRKTVTKSVSEFAVMGKPVKRTDTLAKASVRFMGFPITPNSETDFVTAFRSSLRVIFCPLAS